MEGICQQKLKINENVLRMGFFDWNSGLFSQLPSRRTVFIISTGVGSGVGLTTAIYVWVGSVMVSSIEAGIIELKRVTKGL